MNGYSLLVRKVKNSLITGCILVTLGVLGAPLAYAEMGDRLEVTAATTTLYHGPSTTTSTVRVLRNNEVLVEMERQGSWIFVSAKSSGDQGWVKSAGVGKASTIRKAANKSKAPTKAKAVVKEDVKKKAGKPATKVVEIEIAQPAESDEPYIVNKQTLKDHGYDRGVMFEGATSKHSKTFFFNAPLDSHITNGSFRLLFRTSPNLNEHANIRVSINDVPFKQVLLPHDGAVHELDILLPSSAFKGELVKVTVLTILPVSRNRCFDERLGGIFLYILPESALEISYKPVERSIRDAWRMLPRNVSISLSEGKLSKDQFASTLALMALLVENGKKVEIKRLPEIGDIVIAPKSALEALEEKRRLEKNGKGPDMGKALDHVSNIALIRFKDRSSIVVTDPYDVQPMYLLSNEWKLLGAGQHYRVFRPDNLRAHSDLLGTEGEAAYYSLPLSKLGMDTEAKFITREAVWHTVINPYALPVGVRADFLNLNVIAPVRWEKDPSYELYVFLNDVMVKSIRLDNSGQKQHFTINLPVEFQKQYNDIRIVIQHDIESGDCKGILPFDFVQVTPDSALVVKKDEGEAPTKFSDLSRYFLQGFDTYLEESYLENPESVLHLLARLSADFPLLIDHSRLNFKPADEVLQPDQPFVAVGHFVLGADMEAPVRFDRGRIKIQSPNGESYFDVDQLSRITIAEIVKSPTAYGLWVMPSDTAELPLTERLELAEDDIAFIDSLGVIKTLDSSEPSLAQVYYPDVEDWFDVLGKYRFWFMVLLWFLLTMVVVYLYRMSRSNKLAREEDDELYQADEDRMQGRHAANLHEGHTLDHLDEQR